MGDEFKNSHYVHITVENIVIHQRKKWDVRTCGHPLLAYYRKIKTGGTSKCPGKRTTLLRIEAGKEYEKVSCIRLIFTWINKIRRV